MGHRSAGALSRQAHRLVSDPSNYLSLSIASLWEATIKIANGKMQVPGQSIAFFLQELARFHIELLPIQPDHLRILETIPHLHKDPFDRILLSQSIAEQMPLLSADATLRQYKAHILW